MRLLFLGDIMGRSGRKAISERLKSLREKWRLDFVVVNGENATGGMGLSGSHAKVLIDSGVDCITLGDHAFDQRDMLTFCEQEPRIIRPLNFAKTAPGKGSRLIKAQNGKKVLVAQALGQVFMKKPYDDPFSALDTALKAAPLGVTVKSKITISAAVVGFKKILPLIMFLSIKSGVVVVSSNTALNSLTPLAA